jgi:hypothetical protein
VDQQRQRNQRRHHEHAAGEYKPGHGRNLQDDSWHDGRIAVMSLPPTNPDVDAHAARLSRWRTEIDELGPLLLATDLDEASRWRKPCYLSNSGNIVIFPSCTFRRSGDAPRGDAPRAIVEARVVEGVAGRMHVRTGKRGSPHRPLTDPHVQDRTARS